MAHYVKSVQIWSFSGPFFNVFELNTEIYEVNLRINSKYRPEKTLYLDTFLQQYNYARMYSVYLTEMFELKRKEPETWQYFWC